MNFTKEYKLKLGIEIISAMKANIYNSTIEEGRVMAFEGTSVENLRYEDKADFYTLNDEDKTRVIELMKRRKDSLEAQAIFIADAVLNFIESDDFS